MVSIFISYRRDDAGGHAGRLCDRLSAVFGGDRVFMDVQDIQPGENFPQSIERTIANCSCVIAVIGPRWLDLLRARLDGDDFVRREIGTALSKGILVVPVLVGNARMPPPGDLPADLAALSHRHALEIRDERFDDDVLHLETQLRERLSNVEGAPPRKPQAGARPRTMYIAVAVVALLAIGVAAIALRPSAAISRETAAPAQPPAEKPPQIDGVWIAEMQEPGRPMYRIRLRLALVGDQITGVVEYPTGDGPIMDGQINGRILRFHTEHTPQFESAPATIRFVAEVTDEGIKFTMTDSSGVSTGLAKRVSPSPQ